MPQRVQDKKPKRAKAIQAWLDENISEQKKRYRGIVKEQEDLWPKRKRWYKEFLKIIQTTGFNMNGDMKQIIPKSKLPKEPRRKHKVVF